MIFGAALVVTMIFRPQGLIPSRRRASEMAENIGLGGMGSLGGEIGHLPPREVSEDA
jgi:branched-chain amino acid transport system permease protein